MKKRIISMILTISMLLGSVVLYSVGAYANTSGHGDVDGDGEVTLLDLFFLKSAVNQNKILTEDNVIDADSDWDGEITMIDLFEMKYRIKNGEWRVQDEIPIYTLFTMEEYRAFVEDPSLDLTAHQTSVYKNRVSGGNNDYILGDHHIGGTYSWELFREEGNIVVNDGPCLDKDLIDDKWYGINYFNGSTADFLFSEYYLKEYIRNNSGITPESAEAVCIVEVKSWVPAVAVVLADGEYYFIEISEKAVWNSIGSGSGYLKCYFKYKYELYTYEEYYERYKDADYAYVISLDGTKTQTKYITHDSKINDLVPLSLVFEAIGGEVTYNEERNIIYYSYKDNHYLVALTEDNGVVEYPSIVYKQNEDGVYEIVRMYLWGVNIGTYTYTDGTEFLIDCALMNPYILEDLGYTGEFVGNDYYLSEIK